MPEQVWVNPSSEESPTVLQVECVIEFVSAFMWGCGFPDAAVPGAELDERLSSMMGDERLTWAARWLAEHSSEIVEYMVDSQCAVDEGA